LCPVMGDMRLWEICSYGRYGMQRGLQMKMRLEKKCSSRKKKNVRAPIENNQVTVKNSSQVGTAVNILPLNL